MNGKKFLETCKKDKNQYIGSFFIRIENKEEKGNMENKEERYKQKITAEKYRRWKINHGKEEKGKSQNMKKGKISIKYEENIFGMLWIELYTPQSK